MRAHELEEKWSEKYKRSIDCSNPKGFSQRAHCAGRKKNESTAEDQLNNNDNDFNQVHNAIKDLLPIAMVELGISQLPKIHIKRKLETEGQPSFGMFNGNDITLAVSDRHPVDICRTLAHELTHYSQGLKNQLSPESGETGSPEENEANSVAGVIMRKFSQQFPNYINNESL